MRLPLRLSPERFALLIALVISLAVLILAAATEQRFSLAGVEMKIALDPASLIRVEFTAPDLTLPEVPKLTLPQ